MNRVVSGVLAVVVLGGTVMACNDDHSDTAPSSTPAASTSSAAATTTAAPGDAAPAGSTPATTDEGAGLGDDSATHPEATEEQHGVVTDESVAAALDKIDGFVQAEMDATGVPGIAVAVVHDDEVVFAKGYGVRELGKPETVDPDTVFQIASLSKPVTSTAMAGLVGKGVIEWDEPVHQFNPDLVFAEPYVTDHVTFADLYSHRSGLPGEFGNMREQLGYTRDEILSTVKYLPLAPFRASYSYSNFGMTAAGDAAAKADGKPFEDVMQEQLFGPAGMTDSTADYDDFVAKADRASLHIKVDDKWVLGPKRQPNAQTPAGGVSSSVNDLATWVRLQLGAGQLDGKAIIDEKALDETHVPHIVRPSQKTYDGQTDTYGLGWGVMNDHLGFLRWAHSGAFSAGAATTAHLLPTEQLGVVVLTNGGPMGIAETITDQIIDQIALGRQSADWAAIWHDRFSVYSVPPGPEPPANPAPAQPNEAYVGTYRNDTYGDVEVIAQGDGLALQFGPTRNTYPLTHFDGDTFSFVLLAEEPRTPAPVVFTMGSDGKATSMDIGDLEGTGADAGVLQRVQ